MLASELETLPGKVSMFNWQAWRQRDRHGERKRESSNSNFSKKDQKGEKRERRSKRESPAGARMQESKGQRERGSERHPEKLRTRTRERARGTECADAAFLV